MEERLVHWWSFFGLLGLAPSRHKTEKAEAEAVEDDGRHWWSVFLSSEFNLQIIGSMWNWKMLVFLFFSFRHTTICCLHKQVHTHTEECSLTTGECRDTGTPAFTNYSPLIVAELVRSKLFFFLLTKCKRTKSHFLLLWLVDSKSRSIFIIFKLSDGNNRRPQRL